MARNNPKPTGKVSWGATGNIVEPNAGRKTSGWLFDVKPPAQNFNWFWNLLGLNQFYSNAQVEDWIVIDSDTDEGDYATLAAYIADSPADGNRVLVKQDQTLTSQLIISTGITIKFLDGTRIISATNIATSIVKFSSNVIIEGVLNFSLSHTGTTAKAVEFDGDNVVGKINVLNSSTGTLTTAYHVNANKTGNRISGIVANSGGGVLTNIIVDNSTELSNLFIIVDEANDTIRTNGTAFVDLFNPQVAAGLKTFEDNIRVGKNGGGDAILEAYDDTNNAWRALKWEDATSRWKLEDSTGTLRTIATISAAETFTDKTLGTGTIIALGSDANGDTYYRDAGILKRLPKATDRDISTLISGLPAWVTPDGSYTPTPTNVSNWASGTARPAFWTRTGNIVTVSGLITTPAFSSASIRTRVRLNLPVASNLAAQWDLGGSGTNEDAITGADSISIVGDLTNDEAILTFWPQSTGGGANTLSYEYSYEVL